MGDAERSRSLPASGEDAADDWLRRGEEAGYIKPLPASGEAQLRAALDETQRMLEYLWGATGDRAPDMPVNDLFNDDDPLIQDVPSVLGRARMALAATPAPRDERLEALRALSDAATPGTWLYWPEQAPDGYFLDHSFGSKDGGVGGTYNRTTRGGANARFIVAAVNYVRALLGDADTPPASEPPRPPTWTHQHGNAGIWSRYTHLWDDPECAYGPPPAIDHTEDESRG